MEFLRFGSSIPGSYWGCCAVCIIQNFKVDPDDKASIQLVDGDGGQPLTKGSEFKFAGPTYKDIFLQRLRIGTFCDRDMPNHGFLAVLTQSQISGGVGKKWLAILKEQGFEFIRTVDNSVYSGEGVIKGPGEGCTSSHPNYIFGLFRNVGEGAIADPFTPPKEWTDLPSVVPEAWEALRDYQGAAADPKAHQEAQLPLYNALPKNQWMTEKQLIEAGVDVTLAGKRSEFPQEKKSQRDAKMAKKSGSKTKASNPFDTVAVPSF